MAEPNGPLTITYYSDVLCVFAYASEIKVRTLVERRGAAVRVDRRFCASFGDTDKKIGEGWKDKGGWKAYAAHVAETAHRFPYVDFDPAAWRDVRPATSHSAHLLLKAIQLTNPPQVFDAACWAIRRAFFAEARDTAARAVQREVAAAAGADLGRADIVLADGRAHAALAADYEQAEADKIEGSPTFVFPEGRQKLYGDVGFRILEANVAERLRPRGPDEPAWC